MFQTLPEILHNTEDHLIVLTDILVGNKAQGAARERLLQHIALEEGANLENLSALLESAPSYEAKVARDHSQLILDIIQGNEMVPELGIKLLEHLLEEQREIFKRISTVPAPDGISPPKTQGLTVGSLIGK